MDSLNSVRARASFTVMNDVSNKIINKLFISVVNMLTQVQLLDREIDDSGVLLCEEGIFTEPFHVQNQVLRKLSYLILLLYDKLYSIFAFHSLFSKSFTIILLE